MGLKEGSVIPINLRCGCKEVRITILHGKQRIKCSECGASSLVNISIDSNDEVNNIDIGWA